MHHFFDFDTFERVLRIGVDVDRAVAGAKGESATASASTATAVGGEAVATVIPAIANDWHS
jgi:hypothetical protein